MKEQPFGVDIAACRAYLQRQDEQRRQAREQRRRAVRVAVRAAARSVGARFPGVRRLYLFGSAVHPGALRAVSDVDVAVEGEIDAETFFALWRALEEETHLPIELVALESELRFADRVRKEGEVIYERSDQNTPK